MLSVQDSDHCTSKSAYSDDDESINFEPDISTPSGKISDIEYYSESENENEKNQETFV